MKIGGSSLSDSGLFTSVGIVALIVLLAWVGLQWASPRGADAPLRAPTEFSVERAMEHVREIAKYPHPVGTGANAAVREYILTELRKLQLNPTVQSGFAASPIFSSVGEVHNIVVTLPGRESGKAILLDAHYDSVPTGPGAADNGASVAAVLETLRALKAGSPLRNDVIAVFTDGEEVGLLGAELFVSQYPSAKNISVVLNFDYRGNRGAIALIEMTRGNSILVNALADTKQNIVANSLLYELYKMLPSDTDMTVYRRAGYIGMNFAAGEGYTSYHSALDVSQSLSKTTLQQQGNVMLALTRRFGDSVLDKLSAADEIYFNFPAVGLIHYSYEFAFAITAGAFVLLFVAWRLACDCGLRSSRITLGALIFTLIVVLLAVAAEGFWTAMLAFHPQYRAMLQGDTYNSEFYGLAAVGLSGALFLIAQTLVLRWLDSVELGIGAGLCWFIGLILACVKLPGATFLLAWPLIFMLISLVVVLSRHGSSWSPIVRIAILLAGLVPAVLLGAPLLKLLFVALTPRLLFVMVAVLALFFGIASPVLGTLRPRVLVILSLVLCSVIFLGCAEKSAAFSPERPRPDELSYVLDASTDSRHAYWISGDAELDAWNKRYFAEAVAPRPVPELFGNISDQYWVSPAPTAALPGPRIVVLEDKTVGGTRKLKLSVKSVRAAPRLKVVVEGGTVVSSRVQDNLPVKERRTRWRLDAYGMGYHELLIELDIVQAANLEVRVMDFSYGFPGGLVTPRPDGYIVQPFSAGDTTQVMTVQKLFTK